MNNSALNAIGINASIKKVEEALYDGGWAPRKIRKNPIKKEELIEKVRNEEIPVAIEEVRNFIESESTIKIDDLRNDFASIRLDLYLLFEHQAKIKRMQEEEEEFFLLLVLLNHRKKIGSIEFLA